MKKARDTFPPLGNNNTLAGTVHLRLSSPQVNCAVPLRFLSFLFLFRCETCRRRFLRGKKRGKSAVSAMIDLHSGIEASL